MKRSIKLSIVACFLFLVGWAVIVDNFHGIGLTKATPTDKQVWAYNAATKAYTLQAQAGAGRFRIGFQPEAAVLPGSTSDPTLTVVTDTNVNYSRLEFNDSANTTATFIVPGVVTRNYAGGTVTVNVWWNSLTVTTGDCVWGVAMRNVGTGAVMDAAVQPVRTVTTTVAGTTSQLVKSTITFTPTAAELTAGNIWEFQVGRQATLGGDTLVGDAVIVGFCAYETPAGETTKFKIGLPPEASQLTGATTDPTLTSVLGTNIAYSRLEFNDTTNNTATFVIPGVCTKDYAGGTVTVNIWWDSLTDTTNSCTWVVSMRSVGTGAVMDAALQPVHTVSSAPAGTVAQLVKSSFTFTPTAAELTAGNIWELQVGRNAVADTMVGDAIIVGFCAYED